jgi:RNA polymerase sigma-70 factor (ECF subfamily)
MRKRLKLNHNDNWCETLYRAKAAELLLYGRALGLSHSEAEDMLQETFMALMDRPLPDDPAHYCMRAYRNRALNHKRSLWRRVTREFESHRWFERNAEETPFERRAMRCLAKLPAEQREVIVLKIWHQYTFAKIADLLGVCANTVAGRYRYGINKLKSCLEGKNYERDERDTTLGEILTFMETAPPVGKV